LKEVFEAQERGLDNDGTEASNFTESTFEGQAGAKMKKIAEGQTKHNQKMFFHSLTSLDSSPTRDAFVAKQSTSSDASVRRFPTLLSGDEKPAARRSTESPAPLLEPAGSP
jgi:hypothetical protein